jgi:hypothetical protein
MAEVEGRAPLLIWNWRAAAEGTDSPAERRRRAREEAAARLQGAIGGGVGLAAAGGIFWALHRPLFAAVVAGVSVLVALLALASPLFLYRHLRRALDGFGHGVGVVLTWLLMTLLFYLLFMPVGLAMRAMGKLGFVRFAEPNLVSYWTSTEGRARTPESYRKQF